MRTSIRHFIRALRGQVPLAKALWLMTILWDVLHKVSNLGVDKCVRS